MTLSQKLKSILRILGFTPTILADAVGITIQDVRRILRKDGIIYEDEFIKLCDFLGIKYYIFEYCKKNASRK